MLQLFPNQIIYCVDLLAVFPGTLLPRPSVALETRGSPGVVRFGKLEGAARSRCHLDPLRGPDTDPEQELQPTGARFAAVVEGQMVVKRRNFLPYLEGEEREAGAVNVFVNEMTGSGVIVAEQEMIPVYCACALMCRLAGGQADTATMRWALRSYLAVYM